MGKSHAQGYTTLQYLIIAKVVQRNMVSQQAKNNDATQWYDQHNKSCLSVSVIFKKIKIKNKTFFEHN